MLCWKRKKSKNRSSKNSNSVSLKHSSSSSSKFQLLDSRSSDSEEWWDYKSVWGKDWILGRDGGRSLVSEETVHLVSFTPERLLEYVSDSNNNGEIRASEEMNLYDKNCSANTSDTGLGSDSDASLATSAPPTPPPEPTPSGNVDVQILVEPPGNPASPH